jgi:hypothetical protein
LTDVGYVRTVDAQGFDLDVFESSGKHMHRINKVILEVQREVCPRMYKDQPVCPEVLERMRAHGYIPAHTCSGSHAPKWTARYCEANIQFNRNESHPVRS